MKLNAAFFVVLLLYLICTSGLIDTIDADASIRTAKSLLETGSFRITDASVDRMGFAPAVDGGLVTKLGPGMPMIYLLPVAIGKLCSNIFRFPEPLMINFCVSIINAFAVAWIFRMLLQYFSGQLFWPLAFGFATLLFPYSKSAAREPIQALGLLGVFLSTSRKKYLAAGLFASLGLWIKQAFVVPLLPALLLAGYRILHSERKLHHGAKLLMGPILAVFGLLLFQFHYFGSPWATGYTPQVVTLHSDAWSTHFLDGLYRQFLSLDSGLFYYSPILIVCVVALMKRIATHQVRDRDVAVVASILVQGAFYAKWWDPIGGAALGPRYLVTVLPLFALLIGNEPLLTLQASRNRFFHQTVRTFHFARFRSVGFTAITFALLIWSMALQCVFVSVKPQQYWTLQTRAGHSLETPHWIANIRMFRHKLFQRNEIYDATDFSTIGQSIDLSNAESLQGYHYWWLHLKRLKYRTQMAMH